MERAELNRTTPTCSRSSLLILTFLVVCWIVANMLEAYWLQYITMLAMLPTLTAICYGTKTTKILAFTFCCLLLLLPFGQTIFITLQNLFASLLVKSISLVHSATYWDGNNVYVNSRQYVISSMFVSIQYIMSYLSIGTIFSLFVRGNTLSRIVYVLLFALMPLSCIAVIFLSITLLQIPLSTTQLQIIAWGSTVFSILLTIRYGLKTRLRAAQSHDIDWQNAYPQQNAKLITTSILAMLLLLTNSVFNQFELRPQYIVSDNKHMFRELKNWGSPIVIKDDSHKYTAEYKKNKQSIFVTANSELTNDNLVSIGKIDWDTIKSRYVNLTINNKKVPVNETIMRNNGISRITWALQSINGKYVSNRKINLLLANIYTLQGQKINAATTSITTHVDTDLNAGRETLNAFLQDYMLE